MKNITLCIALLTLSACSYFQPLSDQYPGLPKDIAGLEVVLTAAETGAFAYSDQPLCGVAPKGKLCSDITIVRKIKTAKAAAEKAIAEAKVAKDQPSLLAAQTAVAAFKNISDIVSPKGE